MTASMTAQAIGPPPNVVPSRSSLSAEVTFALASKRRTGKTVTQRLGRRDHVRHDAVHVGRERISNTAHATLHFVEDQQRADFVATAAQRLQKLLAEINRAGEPLHGLDDDGAVSSVTKSWNGVDVAARNETDIKRRAWEAVPLLLRAPGYGARGSGTAVEAAFDGADLRPAGHLERQLQRVLVRLGAAVDEEHAGDGQPGKAHQPFGRARANLHRHGVGLEVAGLRLLGQRAREAGMSVAESGHGMTAIQIEHTLATAVGEPDALAGHHFDRVLRKYRRKKIVPAAAGRLLGSVNSWSLASGPSGRRSRETRGLGQAEHPVHPLHSAARRTLVQVVDHAHDSDGSTVRHSGQMRVVARSNFLHTRVPVRSRG